MLKLGEYQPLTDELVKPFKVVSEDGEDSGDVICTLVPKSFFLNNHGRKVVLTFEQYSHLVTYFNRS